MPLAKLSIKAEAAFYRSHHISNGQSQAFKTFMNGLGANVFEPISKLLKHQRALSQKSENYSTRLMELKKSKQKTLTNVSTFSQGEKISVSYL